MARIAGVNVPLNKRVEVGLTYIYGVGEATARKLLQDAGVDPNTYVRELTDDEVIRLRNSVDQELSVEGDLRRERSQNVKRLMENGSYRGLRHRRGLPANGQRTKTNAPHPQGSPPHAGRRQAQGEEVVAQQRPGRGRGRRRPRRNVPVGQAHIKTSFNNTIVTLTDREGNVLAWESAGAPASRARASRPRSPLR